MQSKLIFLDIDGTLTPPGGYEPPQSALRVIRRARELGHKVFLCSGRNHGMIMPFMKYGFDGGISSCGGYIFAGDRVLYDNPFSEEQKNRLVGILSENGVTLSLESKDEAYNDELPDDLLTPDRDAYLTAMIRAVWVDLGAKTMAEYDGSPVYKIVLTCAGRDKLAQAEAELGDIFRFIVHDFSEEDCLFGEIIKKEFDKGSAVRIAAEALGYDMADTIAFGDSNLDMEMIDAVGTGVCMESGSPLLKERSDLICPSTDKDGIEWAFSRLGLTE